MSLREVEFDGVNLYEMNKNLIQQTSKELSKSKISELKRDIIIPYFLLNKEKDTQYFMLLCHEDRNYTLFNIYGWENDTIDKIMKEFFELLEERGKLYSIDNTEDKIALEIWLSTENGPICYYFFPYDKGVIEIV